MRTGLALAAGGIAALTLVAGCGSSTSTQPTSSSTTPTATPTGTTTPDTATASPSPTGTASTTTTASPSPAPTATATIAPSIATATATATATIAPSTTPRTATVSRCHTSQLKGSVTGARGAAGTDFVTIAMTNTSKTACRFYAYPGIGLLTANRHVMTSHLTRGGSRPPADPGPKRFTVQPGHAGSFTLTYSSVPSGSATSCPTAGYLEVTPPDEKDFLLIKTTLAPCQNGALRVTAVVPGSGGVR